MNLDIPNEINTNSARSSQYGGVKNRSQSGTKYLKFVSPLDYIVKNHRQHAADIINEMVFS